MFFICFVCLSMRSCEVASSLRERGVGKRSVRSVPTEGYGLHLHLPFLIPTATVLVKEPHQRATVGKGHVHDAPLNPLLCDLHIGRPFYRLCSPQLSIKNLATVFHVLAAFHAIRLVRIGRLFQGDGSLLHVLESDLHEAVVHDGENGEESDIHSAIREHNGLEILDPRHVSIEKDAIYDGAVVLPQNGGEMLEKVTRIPVKVVGGVGDAEIAREDACLGGFADA